MAGGLWTGVLQWLTTLSSSTSECMFCNVFFPKDILSFLLILCTYLIFSPSQDNQTWLVSSLLSKEKQKGQRWVTCTRKVLGLDKKIWGLVLWQSSAQYFKIVAFCNQTKHKTELVIMQTIVFIEPKMSFWSFSTCCKNWTKPNFWLQAKHYK